MIEQTVVADEPCSAGFEGGGFLSPEVIAAERDLNRLGDRIAELSAHLHAATYHLLLLIREFDEREGWGGGFRSCAHWLSWRTGINLGAGREKVRVARALADLPLISEGMRRGKLSYSKVRALTRVATKENEARLIVFAELGSASHVERLVRAWRRVDRIEEAARDEKRRTSRRLTTYFDEDGMLVVRGRLDPETGAVFKRALDAAADRLYERATADSSDSPVGSSIDYEYEHLRSDALALVAESALLNDLDHGNRGDRYQVVLHVDAGVLAEADPEAEPHPGMSMLEDAVDVSAETSRRLACDSSVVRMEHDTDGSVLNVGRRTRTISPALRRALLYRDQTCRFPGCGSRICDAHHLKHWADGGETALDNLILLCRRHHRLVHERGYRVTVDASGRVRFFHPNGWELEHSPRPPAPPEDPVEALQEAVFADGTSVDGWTPSAKGTAGPVDYGWAYDWISGEQEEDDGSAGDGGAGEAAAGEVDVCGDGNSANEEGIATGRSEPGKPLAGESGPEPNACEGCDSDYPDWEELLHGPSRDTSQRRGMPAAGVDDDSGLAKWGDGGARDPPR